MFLREGTSGTVDVGTLVFNHNSYRNIVSSSASGLATTVNFGTSPGMDLEIADPPKGSGFGPGTIGDYDSNDAARLTFALPTSSVLNIRTSRGVLFNAKITGNAGVNFSRFNTTGFPTTTIGSHAFSTFSGGATLNTNFGIIVQNNGSFSGGTLMEGPFGVGTTTLAGGALSLAAPTITFSNPLRVVGNSTISGGGIYTGPYLSSVTSGSVTTGHKLVVESGANLFSNNSFSSADAGTLEFTTFTNAVRAENTGPFDAEFHVSSGTSIFGGAITGVLGFDPNGTSNPSASVTKTGNGVFGARHVRAHSIDVFEGTLRINQSSSSGGTPDFVGSTTGTSFARRLTLEGVNMPGLGLPNEDVNPTVRLDLTNNDFILEWSDKFTESPLGGLANNGTLLGIGSTGMAGAIRAAYIGNGTSQLGAWLGNGITSTVAQANTGSFAIAYAESSELFNLDPDDLNVSALFSDQIVSSRAALLKFTYRGDATFNGMVNLDDFTVIAGNFGASNQSTWRMGDMNYDALVNLDDFTILANNFGSGTTNPLRSTNHVEPRQELYVALLDYPTIYWEARNDAETWAMFEPFELLNLGPIPPMPESMRNSIPEPVTGTMMGLLALAGSMNRPRRR